MGMVLMLAGRDRDGAGDILPGQHHLTGPAVHRGYQRSAAGAALLDAALNEAAARASTRVTSWAARDNTAAQRLFARRGFTPATRRTG
jgi:ribosomal protein S18 acetylase RimI-like enzyme